MASSQSKFSHNTAEIKEEKNYRQTTEKTAEASIEYLFEKIHITDSLNEAKEVNVLVSGAGSFPSFVPFVRLLKKYAPTISNIHFYLLDPIKDGMDVFMISLVI